MEVNLQILEILTKLMYARVNSLPMNLDIPHSASLKQSHVLGISCIKPPKTGVCHFQIPLNRYKATNTVSNPTCLEYITKHLPVCSQPCESIISEVALGFPRYPFITVEPRTTISPLAIGAQAFPDSKSTICQDKNSKQHQLS